MSNVFRTGFIHITKEQAIEAFYNEENLYVSFNCSAFFTWVNIETKLISFDPSKSFDENMNLIKMKHVFPNLLNDTFFYIEDLKPIQEKGDGQSFINFSDCPG